MPNELRGGMLSLSQAPANMLFLIFLVHVGSIMMYYFQMFKFSDSTVPNAVLNW